MQTIRKRAKYRTNKKAYRHSLQEPSAFNLDSNFIEIGFAIPNLHPSFQSKPQKSMQFLNQSMHRLN